MIQQKFIGVAIIVLGVAGGAVFIVHERTVGSNSGGTIIGAEPSADVPPIPTPAWYEAHQDVLSTDNARCQAEGTAMPAPLCTNVSIADKEVSDEDALKALEKQ